MCCGQGLSLKCVLLLYSRPPPSQLTPLLPTPPSARADAVARVQGSLRLCQGRLDSDVDSARRRWPFPKEDLEGSELGCWRTRSGLCAELGGAGRESDPSRPSVLNAHHTAGRHLCTTEGRRAQKQSCICTQVLSTLPTASCGSSMNVQRGSQMARSWERRKN